MYAVRTFCSTNISAANEARLPSATVLWRIEKLPVSEIRKHLRVAGLQLIGNKRALAKRLYDSLPARSLSSAEDKASSFHSCKNQSPSSDSDSGSPSPDLTRRHHSTSHSRSRRSPGRRRRRDNSRHSRSTSGSTTTASGPAASLGGSSSSHSGRTTSRIFSLLRVSSFPRRPPALLLSHGERETALTLADDDIMQRRTALPPSQTRAPTPASPPRVLA